MTTFEIKLIAIISMFLDHFAIIFLDNNNILRIIGRLAFPLFAWMISQGFQYTKNIKKYFFRLLFAAIISEFCFDFAFYSKIISFEKQNVIFTLLFGLITIYIYDNIKYTPIALLINFIIAVLASIFRFDYGFYGVFMILLFYIFKDKKIYIIISQIVFNFLVYLPFFINGQFNSCIQLFCLVSLIFIVNYNNIQGKRFKFLFYSFYPSHLIILTIIKRILS